MIKIPNSATITGKLKCDDNVEVLGRLDGESDIKGILIIGKNCVWTGKAVADNVIVEGYVDGCIIARKKLEIKPSATIKGSVISPEVLISKSANLDCEFTMQKNKSAVSLESHRNQKQLVVPKLNAAAKSKEDEKLLESVSTA